MKFVGIKKLARHVSDYVNHRDWVIITKNGKPKKVLLGIDEEEIEDMILSRHFNLEKELKESVKDLRSGNLMTLDEILRQTRKKKAA